MPDEPNEEKLVCSPHFYPLLDDETPYLFMYGGKGSGKSEFAGRKVIKRCRIEGGHNFLILRKVAATNKESTVLVVSTALNEMGIPFKQSLNPTSHEITFNAMNGRPNRILFGGMDVWQKIKSRKGITGIWLEELTEFTRKDFSEVDLAFREDTGHYQQIMATFNPDESLAAWIKEDFFDGLALGLLWTPENPKGKYRLDKSTVLDNPITAVREKYILKLQAIKDPTYRKIYLDGEWAAPKGIIYNWDVVPMPNWTGKHVDIFYGGDFGYTVDMAACDKIYRIGHEFWIEEMLYELGLTNISLGNKLKALDPSITKKPSYWDSAEPKSIQELCDCGLIAKPAPKGPDSVRAGIDYLLECTIHIIEGSPNVVKERKSYKWLEDKNGDIVKPAQPVGFNDHHMSAIRYAITTHCQHPKKSAFIISNNPFY